MDAGLFPATCRVFQIWLWHIVRQILCGLIDSVSLMVGVSTVKYVANGGTVYNV